MPKLIPNGTVFYSSFQNEKKRKPQTELIAILLLKKIN